MTGSAGPEICQAREGCLTRKGKYETNTNPGDSNDQNDRAQRAFNPATPQKSCFLSLTELAEIHPVRWGDKIPVTSITYLCDLRRL